MLTATRKLLALQVRLWLNTFKHRSLFRKITYIVSLLVIASAGGGVGYLTWGFFRAADSPAVVAALKSAGVEAGFSAIAAQVPAYLMTAAFLMGLLANLSVLLQTLYLSGDMEFLLAAPIPARAVFLSKLIQAVVPAVLLLGVVAGPALAGIGYALDYAAAFYAFIPVFIAVLSTAGAGLAAVLVMLIVQILSPRRAAEAIALVGGVTVFLCTQSGQIASMNGGGSASEGLAAVVALAEPLGSPWNPVSWAGDALLSWGTGAWFTAGGLTAGVLAAAGLLFAGTLWTAERMYLSGWSRVSASEGRIRSRRRKAQVSDAARAAAPRFLAWVPAPVRALVRKDALLFRRDLRNLSQLILPVVMAVVWGLSFGGSDRPAFSAESRIVGGFGLFMAVMMSWGFAVRFGMGAFSLEGTRWWIIKISPVRRGHLLAAKYLVAFLPSAGLGILFLLVLAMFADRAPSAAAYDAASLIFVMAAMSSLMLAIGILTAKFDWKDPREVQGGGASGCVISLVSMLTILFLLGVFQAVPLGLELLAGWERGPAWAAGLGIGAAFCLVVGAVPLAFTSSRLDRLGED